MLLASSPMPVCTCEKHLRLAKLKSELEATQPSIGMESGMVEEAEAPQVPQSDHEEVYQKRKITVFIPDNPLEVEIDAYPPLKFSWVIPKKLAAMAMPRHKENLRFLVNQGITKLITLTAGKRPPIDECPELRWSEIPVQEFEVPTIDQIEQFVNICKLADKGDQVVGIHCRQGRGRCSVMLACYLMHFHRMLPEQAISVVRQMRPGSCNEEEHTKRITEYYEYLHKDNPLKFGVGPDFIKEIIEAVRTEDQTLLA